MQETTSQLQQYQQMLMSFEKAKFETMLPQGVPESAIPVRSPEVEAAASFSSLLDKINGDAGEEGETDGLATQEG